MLWGLFGVLGHWGLPTAGLHRIIPYMIEPAEGDCGVIVGTGGVGFNSNHSALVMMHGCLEWDNPLQVTGI